MAHRRQAPRLLIRMVLLILLVSLVTLPLETRAWSSKLVSMPAYGDVEDFEISTDGAYVVYLADADTDEIVELYSVPMSGGTSVRLNSTLVTGGELSAFLISPDGSRVVYRGDQETDGVYELYSVPIAGPASAGVKLNPLLPTGGDVGSGFVISPDGSRVVYRADQDTDGVYELYSVPIAGPASAGVKLNPSLPSGGDVQTGFDVSPDGSWAVYRADQDFVRPFVDVEGIYELYSVPVAGPSSDVVKINHSLRTEVLICGQKHATDDVQSFKISPDSSRVAYRAKRYVGDCDHVSEVFSVPIRGPYTDSVKLNGTLVAGGNVGSKYEIGGNSSRVVYEADQETVDVYELYSVPITGPASSGVKLTDPAVFGGSELDLNSFKLSPDGNWVLFQAELDDFDLMELYSVPAVGPTSSGVKLNGPLPTNAVGVSILYQISPDSSRVVYHADQDTHWVRELYSVPTGGPASAGVKLNRPLPENSQVGWGSYQISPDSSRVVYGADQDTFGVWELYSVPIGGPASAGVKLNGPLVAGGDVSKCLISPDSSQVVYRADQDTDAVDELYATGGEAPYAVYLPIVLR
jgi:Tol biopolymer transport system component